MSLRTRNSFLLDSSALILCRVRSCSSLAIHSCLIQASISPNREALYSLAIHSCLILAESDPTVGRIAARNSFLLDSRSGGGEMRFMDTASQFILA